jgi:large subunit ribosomal protein L4
LKAKGTALLVEQANSENKNLALASRNLDGVELVSGNQVHPYHLLRYEYAVFSRPAIEKLQDSLKATASSRRREHAQKAESKPRRRARREKVGEVA